MFVAVARRRWRLGVPFAIVVAIVVAGQHADAANAPARCPNGSVRLVLGKTEGTATQMVAFLSVLNRGVACQLITAASLTVMHKGVRVPAIRGNPVSYRVNQTIGHGTTMLFDAWWENWCGSRSGPFRVRGALGAQTATAPYPYLPDCIGASGPSRLRGVRTSPLPTVSDPG